MSNVNKDGDYTIYHTNGDKEEGTIISGKKEGKAIYYYKNGDTLSFKYLNDKKNGKSRLKSKN